MDTLVVQIRYDNRRLLELSEYGEQKQIVDLAMKLRHLREKIIENPEGIINIKKSGRIVLNFFPADVTKQIEQLLNK